MGCLIALVALLSPRFALFLVWLFSDRIDLAFDGWFVPLLGFFFLPWTTLIYTFAYEPVRGVSGLGWLFVILAVFVDVASWGSGAREQRSRYA